MRCNLAHASVYDDQATRYFILAEFGITEPVAYCEHCAHDVVSAWSFMNTPFEEVTEKEYEVAKIMST